MYWVVGRVNESRYEAGLPENCTAPKSRVYGERNQRRSCRDQNPTYDRQESKLTFLERAFHCEPSESLFQITTHTYPFGA
jgi:hypothetical protein